MARILALSGSLREHSYNSGMLRAAQALHPGHIEAASIRDIPLYDADVEARGMPAAVAELQQRLAAADGLLLFSPEYNNSVPGVTKNAIDWLSRPAGEVRNLFEGKPVAVAGATPGSFGTILGQGAWLPVFRGLRARYWSDGRLMVPEAGKHFDSNGELSDPEIRDRLDGFVRGFISFCAASA